uniref:Pollen Ole e 1 allergen and extensin family protein n=1 Tax=Picea sitchensis TaxID=3332 RepID=A9NZS8_PICSI|nr:unknown [Picea sitchensis]
MASIHSNAISITVLGFFLCCLSLVGASTFAGQEKDSSVVVVGKVFCDTCLEHRLSENSYFISGASIAVECGLNRKTMTLSIIGETDENGEFRVELPSNILQSADQLNKCWVSPRNSPLRSCKIPSTSAPSKLTLQSVSNGVVTYSAGSFSYRHETVPPSCYREDFLTRMRGREMAENVDQSSKAVQQTPTIPSLPKLPPASLPSVPPFPKLSVPPLPSVPSIPKAPPLPSIPPLPSVPPTPKTPPLPSIPPLPSVPPFPITPPLPPFSFPPFPKPTIPGSPPLPQIPQIPQIPNFQFPPIPFLTPPPPGH